jgi:hypothetical protein
MKGVYMKKFLFITAFPVNNRTAGQNYTKNLIKELSDNYLIDIINFEYEEHENTQFSNNIQYIKKVKNSKLTKLLNIIKVPFIHPFFTSRFSLKILLYILNNRNKYDYIYFDFSQSFLYSLFIKNKDKFLMTHDIIAQKYKRKKISSSI